MKNRRNQPASPLKAYHKHLIVPKDTDGAHRVHGRLDGLRITSPEQQAALRDLETRGLTPS